MFLVIWGLNECCICDLNVYVCVNFGDEILLRGKEYKTQVNLKFFKKGQNGKLLKQFRL